MSLLDREKILTSNNQKRLNISYNNLKEVYNEDTIADFSSTYENESLSFILSNSRYIFAEPQRGLPFYKKIISKCCGFCSFTKMQRELDKVRTYIDEFGDKMSPGLKDLYNGLRADIEWMITSYGSAIDVANYIKNTFNVPDEVGTFNEESWAGALYQGYITGDIENLISLAETINQVEMYLLYVPYGDYVLSESNNNNILSRTIRWFDSALEASDALKGIVVANKLNESLDYRRAVTSMTNKFSVFAVESMIDMNIVTELEDIDKLVVTTEDAGYSTPSMLISNIFDDMEEDELFHESYEEEISERESLKKSVYECMSGIIDAEVGRVDDLSTTVKGYDMFSEGTSLEKAQFVINDMLSVMEAKEVKSKKEKVSEDDGESPKKVDAPEKNQRITTRIQNRAMDLEAKQNKARANVKQRGQELGNAVRAVANLPKNVFNDIKEQFRKVDDADDERRRKYMQEPGFRKKGFRNLKLAILYGTAAQIKLALLPITMVCRHFSKEKDRRIRNELAMELETEIKVCEEKINDANSDGDKKEKYRLIRLKDKLEIEKERVLTNSKYI